MLEKKVALERAGGLEMHLLSAAEVRERAPYVSPRMVGAAFCPIEGKANPLTAAPAFATAAATRGARILEQQQVTAIHRVGSGFEVVTERGTFCAARLVNAAGSDAGRIAALGGMTVSTQSFPIQLSVTAPLAPLIEHLVYAGGQMLTLKQTRNGTVLIGGGWPAVTDADGRARVSSDSLHGNLALACEVVPALEGATIVRAWAAHVNGNDSWLPLIGEFPGVPDFFINYVPWMGFSGAPAASRIAASLVQGRDAPVGFDITAFQP
jgi:glycine/D-amino acid oxidase-like deaminating enzyme